MDRDLIRHAQPHQLSNGPIITEIDTEYFLVFGDDRRQFVGSHRGRVCKKDSRRLERRRPVAALRTVEPDRIRFRRGC